MPQFQQYIQTYKLKIYMIIDFFLFLILLDMQDTAGEAGKSS